MNKGGIMRNSVIFRGAAFAAGAALLALVSVRDTPWTMKWVWVPDGGSDALAVLCVVLLGAALWKLVAGRIKKSDWRTRTALGAAALMFGFTLCSVTGTAPIGLTLEEPPVFLFSARPLVLYSLLSGLAVLLMLPAVAGLLTRAGHRLGRLLFISHGRFFALSVFGVFFLMTCFFSWHLFELIPHVQDSITQVFHGKMMASGRLTAPMHPYSVFFDFGHMINSVFFYSMYPFGHLVWMALGAWIRAPWVMNPLLGALTIVLLYLAGREMYDEWTGRMAAVLGCASPFLMFMSSEYMSHGSALFCLSAFLWAYVRSVKRGGLGWCVVAGAAMGMALNTRLLTAAAVGVPFAVHALILLAERGGFRRFAGRFAVMGLTVSAFVALMLVFNGMTTGDPLVVGYEVVWGRAHHPGFGGGVQGHQHTPLAGLVQTLTNLNALNKYLFEWPLPGLLFMVVPLAVRTKNRWDGLLLGVFWALPAAYFFYWFNDWCFGPRFLYEASGAAILLSARGLRLLPDFLRRIIGVRTARRILRDTMLGAAAMLIVLGWGLNVPALIRLYGRNYWDVNRSVIDAVKAAHIHHAVVFVRSYYAGAFAENTPLLDGDIIYARDLGEHNQLLMAMYPDRKFYTADCSEIRELSAGYSGVIKRLDRMPFFRDAADALGWRYEEVWLKPWCLFIMDPEHPEADGIIFDGQTHPWEANPVEQWAEALCVRAEESLAAGDVIAAAALTDRVLSVWPEYVPGLRIARKAAMDAGDEKRAENLAAQIREWAEPDVPLQAAFRNGVVLRGVRVTPAEIRAGGELEVTFFWHIPQTVSIAHWAVYLNIKDSAGKTRARGDGVLCQDAGVKTRQADLEEYVETRRLRIPDDAPTGDYTLHFGLMDANPPYRKLIIPGSFPGRGRYGLAYPRPIAVR